MLSANDSSYTRSLLFVIGLVVLAQVAVVPVSPSTTVDQTTPPNTDDEHTLIIETPGEPIQYTLSASGSISGESGENDAVQGKTLSGRVGGVPWNNTTDDTKDTITYTGHIETFQYRGDDPQLQLDGQGITSDTLSANHLQIVRPNSANDSPINYKITVSGDATPGESADGQDQTTATGGSNATQIQGKLTDQYDSFYFTGNISNRSIDQRALVFVNGQNNTLSVGEAGTPTETATSTPTATATSTASTATPTSTPVTTTNQQTTADGNETASAQSSSSPLGFLLRIASGVILVGFIGAVVWYLLPRQRRW